LPVVPDEAWSRTISSIGLAKSPNGYVSRRSVLTVNGSFGDVASDAIDAGVRPRSSIRVAEERHAIVGAATTDWSRCSWIPASCSRGR
jgi:hypothetical protein